MAVASSADRVKINANLRVAGIAQSDFKAVISGEDVINKKPSPEIYEKAAGAIGVHPGNCIVIEDALNGIQAAKAAGMRCVAVTTSFTKEMLEKEKPDYICSSIGEVYGIISKLCC
jgi:HAD superfamily hydrolase (TIGR01509 family)